MKNILHVSYDMGTGGAERALFQLIRGQTELGLKPSLAVLTQSGFYGDKVAELGVPIYDLHQKRSIDLTIGRRFVPIAKEHDCVHFQMQTPSLMRAAGRRAAVPSVYTHRSGEPRVRGKRRLMHYIAGKLISKYVHGVSGNTSHAATCARASYRLPHKEVLVTYNGIDFSLLNPKRTREEVLREIGEDPKEQVWKIGTSSRLRDWKWIDLLIQAVAELPDENLRCYVIGDGPARQDLEKLTHKLDLTQRVRFLGKQEHVGDFLQFLDGFALVSDEAESFGNSAVEPMGLGIPTVVMADGGGMVEHFPPEHGPLPRTVDELVCHIKNWIQNPVQAKQMATTCRDYVVNKYTIDKMVLSISPPKKAAMMQRVLLTSTS